MSHSLVSKRDVPSRSRDLRRIAEGLRSAGEIFRRSHLDLLAADKDPGRVAALEQAVDLHLKLFLPETGEGWLSEESTDDLARLSTRRVWIVDPLDGTREFAAGIPEWSISIGLIEDGLAVAGGVLNPATGELFLGAIENGVTLNGKTARLRQCTGIDQAIVLASRSEVGRGEWDHLQDAPFHVVPMGSVAYKLARLAAGLADATWTSVSKHEWDVAAGVALVRAAGGIVDTQEGQVPRFNRSEPLFEGLFAFTESSRRLFTKDSSPCGVWQRKTAREADVPVRLIVRE
jgi:myo-inositol-1(or 4)-monophosphatase